MKRAPVVAVLGLALCSGLLLAQADRPQVRLPAETAGWDNVLDGLSSAFDRVEVLALGETHNRKIDSDLRLRLIRHPEFAKKVHSIVVEATGDQPLLSRYVRGDSLSPDELGRLWPPRPSPLFTELVNTIRDVNQKSPSKPLTMFFSPRAGEGQDRNALAAGLIRDRVSIGDKVLVIYGAGHTWHREGGLTSALERSMPGRVFVAEVFAPVTIPGGGRAVQELDASLKELEDALSSQDRPVLISLKGTRAAALIANPFYLGQAMLPPATTIGELDDACIFFGRAPELGTFVSTR